MFFIYIKGLTSSIITYFRVVKVEPIEEPIIDVTGNAVLLRWSMLKDVNSNWTFNMYEYSYTFTCM